MRGFLIMACLFVLRFIFLPNDIEGDFSFAYHILLGIFIGMIAVIIDNKIERNKLNKENKDKQL